MQVPLLESTTAYRVNKFHILMDPKGHYRVLKEPHPGPYPEPDESGSHPPSSGCGLLAYLHY